MLSEKKETELTSRLAEIDQLFLDPNFVKDQQKYKEVSKERNNIQNILSVYSKYTDIHKKTADTEAMVAEHKDDPEFLELVQKELEDLVKQRDAVTLELEKLLIKKDPNDEKNVFMEIRAGAGGEESSIFAADLFRMYQRYCEENDWKMELIDSHSSDLKGFKELILYISGTSTYFNLKYESGVHRVQRVPLTESQGRVHTSTVTVAVLPEVEEEEVFVDPKDLKVDTYRASGAGGQHVNKTDSAIRITHLPSGIVVTSQDQRSQHQNRAKAMQVLRAKLFEAAERDRVDKLAKERKQQIGTGERSEKIRTYNYPQNRLTDHRINLTLYKLDRIMDGDLDEVISALQLHLSKKLED